MKPITRSPRVRDAAKTLAVAYEAFVDSQRDFYGSRTAETAQTYIVYATMLMQAQDTLGVVLRPRADLALAITLARSCMTPAAVALKPIPEAA